MANIYQLGDAVRCTGTFSDSAGSPQDPAAVLFEFRDPSENIGSYQYGQDVELVRSATGIYYTDVDCDEAGWWHYRFYSTGAGQAADEEQFRVADSVFD